MSKTPRVDSEVCAANAAGSQPVVFIHGLWTLAESWKRWQDHFEDRGYSTVAVDWPGDPASVEDARRDPGAFVGQSVGGAVDHVAEVVASLTLPPVLVGHSFGGQLAEIISGSGAAAATVSIDRAPGRAVAALDTAIVVPRARMSVQPLACGDVGVPAVPVFVRQCSVRGGGEGVVRSPSRRRAGAAVLPSGGGNLNPASQTRTDVMHPDRGPMLLIAGENDHTAPPAISRAAYARQRRNEGVTEYFEFAGRGHTLDFDSGWRDVADTVLAFLIAQGIRA